MGDRSAHEVARKLGISVDSVQRWVKRAKHDRGRGQDGLSSSERQELVCLRQ